MRSFLKLSQWSIACIGLFFLASAQAAPLDPEEGKFLDLINGLRNALNLPKLQIQALLQQSAENHSAWMATQDFLTHFGPTAQTSPFQRMKDAGYSNYTYAGENIACGNSDAMQTFLQWAYSPEHLKNMLSPHFYEMGIARAGTGKEQCPYYWTNDFGSFRDPNSDSAEVTDLSLIQKAIAKVSGINRMPSLNVNQELPELIQCKVPYALGKGTFTQFEGVESTIEISRNGNQRYEGRVSFLSPSKTVGIYPILLGQVSVIKSNDFPLISILSSPGSRMTGFSLLLNTQTLNAQLDTFPNKTEVLGTVPCTLKWSEK